MTKRTKPLVAFMVLLGACSSVSTMGWQGEVDTAQQLLSFRENARAYEILDSVYDQNQDNEEVLLALGETYTDSQAVLRARATYRRLGELGKTRESQLGLGRIALKTNRPTEARNVLSTLIDNNSDSAEIYTLLGVSYDLDGNHEEAKAQYWKALEIKPDHPNTLNNLGFSAILSGDYSFAIMTFEDLAQSYPRNDTYMLNLAVAYVINGNESDFSRLALTPQQRAAAQEISSRL